MKQLAYLTNSESKNRFDDLFDKLDISVDWFDIDKASSLVTWIMRTPSLPQMDYILIDLFDDLYSNEHILSATQYARALTTATLIFLSPKGDRTTELFGQLASGFNLSSTIEDNSNEEEVGEKLEQIIKGENPRNFMQSIAESSIKHAKQASHKTINLADGIVVTFNLAGTMNRCGCTTQCFALYHFLKKIGLNPLLILSPSQLEQLVQVCDDCEEKENHHIINGVCVATAQCEKFNAFISDIGVLEKNNILSFLSSDFPLLVGGTKPWELTFLFEKLLWCKDNNVSVLLSFSSSATVDEIAEYIGDDYEITPYYPDIWNSVDNDYYLDKLLYGKIKEYCGGI